MAACELIRYSDTQYCIFAIDSSGDIGLLPTSKEAGKDGLKLSKPCCQGSFARGIDGKNYILDGSDTWVEYTGGSSGGGGGSTISIDPIGDDFIRGLFQ